MMDREILMDSYIEAIIDGMDHKDLWQFVYDTIEHNLETYTDEELKTEIKDYYPHLLEVDGIKVTYGDEMKESS
tara:strand:- start:1 stop:222 length:222 start_codon:yes stop_codon:yes gene_type:complete